MICDGPYKKAGKKSDLFKTWNFVLLKCKECLITFSVIINVKIQQLLNDELVVLIYRKALVVKTAFNSRVSASRWQFGKTNFLHDNNNDNSKNEL